MWKNSFRNQIIISGTCVKNLIVSNKCVRITVSTRLANAEPEYTTIVFYGKNAQSVLSVQKGDFVMVNAIVQTYCNRATVIVGETLKVCEENDIHTDENSLNIIGELYAIEKTDNNGNNVLLTVRTISGDDRFSYVKVRYYCRNTEAIQNCYVGKIVNITGTVHTDRYKDAQNKAVIQNSFTAFSVV